MSSAVSFDPAVNMARQALYRFAALSLADPQTGSWQRLDELRGDHVLVESAATLRALPEARPAKLGMGERAASFLDPQLVLARLADSQCAFNAEYENTFGLVVSSDCPPYETEYIDSKFAFQRSNALADISGFYHAFGLAIADTHAERADHVALELEFMATLLSLERHAADGDFRERRLTVCREAQARFLMDHLAWWIPLFSALLAREHRGGFYEAVAVFLSALIPAERALLNVDVQSPPGSPDPQQQPDGCDGCPLAM